jgi:hypothetical protein
MKSVDPVEGYLDFIFQHRHFEDLDSSFCLTALQRVSRVTIWKTQMHDGIFIFLSNACIGSGHQHAPHYVPGFSLS